MGENAKERTDTKRRRKMALSERASERARGAFSLDLAQRKEGRFANSISLLRLRRGLPAAVDKHWMDGRGGKIWHSLQFWQHSRWFLLEATRGSMSKNRKIIIIIRSDRERERVANDCYTEGLESGPQVW